MNEVENALALCRVNDMEVLKEQTPGQEMLTTSH